jgi:uncharacterized protein YoxC
MTDPIFWLGLSLFLVAISLTAVLIVALPALQELGRASRSAEKLFDTLRREFPPTLEAIRLTGLEISELSDDLNQGVKSASEVVKQVDQSITDTKNQVKKVSKTSRQVIAGVKAAWQTWQTPPKSNPSSKQKRLNPSKSKDLGFSAHQNDLLASQDWPTENPEDEKEILNS